jgi:hypothetical protein
MGRFGNNKREIIHKGVVYNSIVEASRKTGIPKTTISSALRSSSCVWRYTEYEIFADEFFIDHPILDIEVSNAGRIRRSNGVITYGNLRSDGYRYFHHYRTKKNYAVHRLVAETFIENEYNHPCVNHHDECKDNNRWDNLSWVSQKENVRHSIK